MQRHFFYNFSMNHRYSTGTISSQNIFNFLAALNLYEKKGLHILAKNLLEREPSFRISALHYSAETGNTSLLSFLLDCNTDINASDFNGRTALYFALEEEQQDAAALLIEKGAYTHFIDKKTGVTPLILAMSNGYFDMFKKMLRNGAPLFYNETPLLPVLFITSLKSNNSTDIQRVCWELILWLDQQPLIFWKQQFIDLLSMENEDLTISFITYCYNNCLKELEILLNIIRKSFLCDFEEILNFFIFHDRGTVEKALSQSDRVIEKSLSEPFPYHKLRMLTSCFSTIPENIIEKAFNFGIKNGLTKQLCFLIDEWGLKIKLLISSNSDNISAPLLSLSITTQQNMTINMPLPLQKSSPYISICTNYLIRQGSCYHTINDQGRRSFLLTTFLEEFYNSKDELFSKKNKMYYLFARTLARSIEFIEFQLVFKELLLKENSYLLLLFLHFLCLSKNNNRFDIKNISESERVLLIKKLEIFNKNNNIVSLLLLFSIKNDAQFFMRVLLKAGIYLDKKEILKTLTPKCSPKVYSFLSFIVDAENTQRSSYAPIIFSSEMSSFVSFQSRSRVSEKSVLLSEAAADTKRPSGAK